MPQFSPGSVHKSTVTYRNPKSAGFDYQASLCMGTGWTEMASASFHLNAGESKAVEFTVTMPATAGTYPVYLKVTCGGVLIGTFAANEDVVIAFSQVVLSYTNKNNAGTTHWNAYDLDTGNWLTAGLSKLITESISFLPAASRLFLVFREARNAFYDIVDYGPYVMNLPSLGSYTWDAQKKQLNGVNAISLMNASGAIRAKIVNQGVINSNNMFVDLQIISATGSPGSYFVGRTIRVETNAINPSWPNLAGTEITGTITITNQPPSGQLQYPGFTFILTSIGYPLGLPDFAYSVGIALAGSYAEDNSGHLYWNAVVGAWSIYGFAGDISYKILANGSVIRSWTAPQSVDAYNTSFYLFKGQTFQVWFSGRLVYSKTASEDWWY